MRARRHALRAVLIAGLGFACATPVPDPVAEPPAAPSEPGVEVIEVDPLQACPETRPEVCTRDYRPVCASVDTGVRCVKAPCPASEWKTYPNACSACADPKVIGHLEGTCPEPPGTRR